MAQSDRVAVVIGAGRMCPPGHPDSGQQTTVAAQFLLSDAASHIS